MQGHKGADGIGVYKRERERARPREKKNGAVFATEWNKQKNWCVTANKFFANIFAFSWFMHENEEGSLSISDSLVTLCAHVRMCYYIY